MSSTLRDSFPSTRIVPGFVAFLALCALLLSLLSGVGSAPASAASDAVLTDTMDRTVANGWGADPSGHDYALSSSADASVADGAAVLTAPAPGRTATARWGGDSVADVDLVTTLSLPTPSRGSAYVSTHVRDTGEQSYAVRLRVLGSGRTELSLVAFTGHTARVLVQQTVDLGDAVGSGVRLEIRAVGTETVELRGRAWAAGADRPEWQLAYSDSSDERIAQAGGLAWSSYASVGGEAVPVSIQEVSATHVAGTGEAVATGCADGAVVCDTFSRSPDTGWGDADAGGTWSSSSGAVLGVDGGSGVLSSPAPGRTSIVRLDDVVPTDPETTFDVALRALPASGSGIYLTSAARVTDAGAYGARLRVTPGGVAYLQLVRLSSSLTSATIIASTRLDDTVVAGSRLRIVFEVTGGTDVTLAAKAWPVAAAEPADWAVEAVETSDAALVTAGGVGFTLYSSSGGGTPPVAIDTLSVLPGAGDEAPVEEPGAEPGPDPDAEPQPEEPEPEPEPGTDTDGVRGTPGAAAPGTLDYAASPTAVHVSLAGSDTADGTSTRPVRTITAALRKVPGGGTIVVHEGVYHEEVIVPPQKRVTIQPAAGEEVWLDGAETVTGWRSSGSVWVKDGWTLELDSSPTYTKGAPDGTTAGWQFVNAEHPMAAHPDQVWVAGEQLTEVSSRSQVVDGTFYVDDAADQLVIGTNPSGKTVEASTLTQALSIRSAGSEVRGIGVRRYATSVPQMGTVVVAANDVTLTDVTVQDNSTTGVYSWSLRTTLTRVSVIGNGLLGAGASTADGLRVDGMLSVGNNAEQFNRAPVSGAFKVTRSRDIEVTDSAFLDNLGQGPWFDESVYDITFTGNDVTGNTGNGLVLELSEKVIVADNIVSDNALNGILVVDTGNVSIWNNTAVGNQRNISIIQDSRRASDVTAAGHDPRQPLPDPTVPWITRNTVVANNIVGDAGGNCLVCVEDRSHEYTGSQLVSQTDGNVYYRADANTPAWFGVWSRGAGDPQVTSTLAAFTAATGQESRSVLLEGETAVDDGYVLREDLAASESTIALSVPASVSGVSHLVTGARVLGAQPR